MKKLILKKNSVKKVLAIALCAAITGSCFSVPVSAASVNRVYTGSFSKAWERYASSSNGNANLTYGYNTFLINEDYAWAKHSTLSHYAAIYNSKGWHTGPGKSAGKTSKIEVTHNGDTIYYYCYY